MTAYPDLFTALTVELRWCACCAAATEHEPLADGAEASCTSCGAAVFLGGGLAWPDPGALPAAGRTPRAA